jgi:hypothetical protein
MFGICISARWIAGILPAVLTVSAAFAAPNNNAPDFSPDPVPARFCRAARGKRMRGKQCELFP